MSIVREWTRRVMLAATLIGLASLVADSASADSPVRIIAVTTAVDVKVGADATASIVVAPGVSSVLASLDNDKATLRLHCDDQSTKSSSVTISIAPPLAKPEAMSVCLTGVSTGSAHLVLVGDEGSSVSISVTISNAESDDRPTAPSSIQLVSNDENGELTIPSGFATTALPLSIVASGPNKTAIATLSTSRVECDAKSATWTAVGDATSSTAALPATGAVTTTSVEPTTSPSSEVLTTAVVPGTVAEQAVTTTSGPPVYLTACGLSTVGTYTAKFDLNGDADGGDLTVTAIRRLSWTLALLAVSLGIIVSLVVSHLIGKAKSAHEDATSEKLRQTNELIFNGIVADLALGGPEISRFVDIWAPQRWESLSYDSVSTSPTPAAASELYARAAVCVRSMVDLWSHYRNANQTSTGIISESMQLPHTALVELQYGIASQSVTETPENVVLRLESRAAGAHVALGEELYLLAEIHKHPDQRPELEDRRLRLANSKLAEVLAAIEVPPNEENMKIMSNVRFGYAANLWQRSWDTATVVASPTAGPPPNPARAALASGWAQGVAIALGLAAAIPVAMTDALNPTAVWGTTGDIVKMFGAAITLPTLVDQARKLASASG